MSSPWERIRAIVTLRGRWRSAVFVLLASFAALNIVAYQHARSMVTFTTDGARTPPPQTLSFWDKVYVLACGVTIPRPENERSPHDIGLSCETLHFVAEDTTSLEGWLIEPANAKGTVLLFHGYAAARSTLLDQARALHELGFATVLTDFRGSGGSDGHTTSLGYHEARDVAATLRHARERKLPTPVILYGQSMGGAAILRSIAVHEVRPDAVILESVFGRTLGAVGNRFALMRVPAFPADHLLVFWGGVHMGYSGFDHNPEDYARACSYPTLVLHGSEDRHALRAEGEAIHRNLPGRKELVIFDGAGHTSLHAFDAVRWRSEVGEFLRR